WVPLVPPVLDPAVPVLESPAPEPAVLPFPPDPAEPELPLAPAPPHAAKIAAELTKKAAEPSQCLVFMARNITHYGHGITAIAQAVSGRVASDEPRYGSFVKRSERSLTLG